MMQTNQHKYLVSFGRKRARPLKKKQQQLMEQLLPELTIFLPEKGKLDLSAYFPGKKEIWLEIGYGNGEHLALQAKAHPEVGMIGCEVYENGISALLTEINNDTISNIRLFKEDARLLLEQIPEGALDRIFILFPDPWPKRKHHKRRLISKETLDLCSKILKSKGKLRIATDHKSYLDWILIHTMCHTDFKWMARTKDDWENPQIDHVETRYQKKELEGNKGIFLDFERV